MSAYTLGFDEIAGEALPHVGGKGANLAILSRAGVRVPPGFCVTTEAFRAYVAALPRFGPLLDELAALAPDDVDGARRVGGEIREEMTTGDVPDRIVEEITASWRQLGAGERPVAVRSSATAEDLPDASFAGQQDTYLNVIGEEAVVDRARACWASLFTDRAILYRNQNGIAHAEVALSVVVQQMVQPQKSGILFTADPVTNHHGVTTIDAGFGLGEALVSGLINPDLYKVRRRTGEIFEVSVGDKALEIVGLPGGGTERRALEGERRQARVLDDAEIRALVEEGARIQALYGGAPQDVEWCIEDGELFIVQARPITSLYPRFDGPAADHLEVALSVGHPQMLTDPMKPLGLSTIKNVLPVGRRLIDERETTWIRTAGGRLYLEISRALRFGPSRKMALGFMGIADSLIQSTLKAMVSRPELKPGPRLGLNDVRRFGAFMVRNVIAWLFFRRLDGGLRRAHERIEANLLEVRAAIDAKADLLGRVTEARRQLQLALSRVIHVGPLVASGRVATRALARLRPDALDDVKALERGYEGNVTTEMTLEVGDLADVARGLPEVRRAIQDGEVDRARLRDLPDGARFDDALEGFLARYGMRGPGEFDLTRPRWSDEPASLLSMLRGNLGHDEMGAHRAEYDALRRDAEAAGARLVETTGWPKRALVRRLIRVVRSLAPGREHPKFFLVRVMATVRALALEAGDALVEQGRVDRADDVFFLEHPELIAALNDPALELRARVDTRRVDYERFKGLTPPRVLTSEGEAPKPERRGDLPPGALGGAGVSAGRVEGVARVVTDPTAEILAKGEILVAPFTDPGWTPLFINAAGVVLEVGGMMTHGSVVAREYGIPCVVCVQDATRVLRSGQRVVVDGDAGFVRVIDEETA
jgi:pyruvate,water dikinase